MASRKEVHLSRSLAVKGRGLVGSVLGKVGKVTGTVLNKAIDLLPFEAHVPSYNYCGPGTRLGKRLARGDKGVNPLDEACKLHDIAYSKYSDSDRRREADKELAERAWSRFKASDSTIGEKATAWAVTTAMKAKTAIGGGGGKRRKRRRSRKVSKGGEGLYLRPYPKKGGGRVKKRKRTVMKKKKRQSH